MEFKMLPKISLLRIPFAGEILSSFDRTQIINCFRFELCTLIVVVVVV